MNFKLKKGSVETQAGPCPWGRGEGVVCGIGRGGVSGAWACMRLKKNG